MYVPNGYGYSEVGDVEVFSAGDDLHLFHLTLPNHDVVEHAVSRDGLAWRALPAALRTGDPGACDDDQIWTMSVVEGDGDYVMLYTALARAEDGFVQRVALARSPDLIRWTKDARNPVAAADPRWYEADPGDSGRVSWRDPKPIRVGDTYFATVCAREKDGPLLRRGCIGLLASPDLHTWEARPPLFAPRRSWDLECPQVFVVDGGFYLTAALLEDGAQRYWSAPRFEGPYAVPADGGILAPPGHYAGRVCRWQGLDLYVCWHRPAQQRGFGGTTTVDWTAVRNPFGKFVVAPLVLSRRPDGSLARSSFPGWAAYRDGEPTAHVPMAASLLHGRRPPIADPWQVDAPDGRMDVLTGIDDVADVWLEGELTLDARAGGLAFRVDAEAGDGYFVEVTAGASEVVLRKWLLVRNPHDARPWFHVVELQRGRLPTPISFGDRVPFRLLVVGPYVECSLAGEVVLATLSAERSAGRLGLWAESGSLRATDIRYAPMRRPRHG